MKPAYILIMKCEWKPIISLHVCFVSFPDQKTGILLTSDQWSVKFSRKSVIWSHSMTKSNHDRVAPGPQNVISSVSMRKDVSETCYHCELRSAYSYCRSFVRLDLRISNTDLEVKHWAKRMYVVVSGTRGRVMMSPIFKLLSFTPL